MDSLFTIFLAGFTVVVTIILYILYVVNPKQEKRLLEQKKGEKEKNSFLNLQDKIIVLFKGIQNSLPPCKKCKYGRFQLWKIEGNGITLRCTTCGEEYGCDFNITDSITHQTVNFVNLLNEYLDKVDSRLKGKKIKFDWYMDTETLWDYDLLKEGTPLYRGITLVSNPNFKKENNKYDNISNDKPSRRILKRVKKQVWNRDGGKCVECGSREKLEYDHIIPFSKGGSNGYRNIQLLCENCNRSKSNQIG